jgi:hypothetical protein
MVLLMMAILTGVRWNLSVVLIFISFMDRDGEHFFMTHPLLLVVMVMHCLTKGHILSNVLLGDFVLVQTS